MRFGFVVALVAALVGFCAGWPAGWWITLTLWAACFWQLDNDARRRR